jgi:hypothetical protein
METNTKTETCDYCDAPVWGYQNGGRSKTCEHHVTRPFEEMKKATTLTFAYSDKDQRAWSHPTEGWATEADRAFISAEFRAAIEAHPEFRGWTDDKWKACVECDEMITKWWLCEEGDAYCAGCFATTGASCGGCANDECVQCNDSDSDSEDEEDEGPKETCPHCGDEEVLTDRSFNPEWTFAKRVCWGCYSGEKDRECEDCGFTFNPSEDSTFLVCGDCYDRKQRKDAGLAQEHAVLDAVLARLSARPQTRDTTRKIAEVRRLKEKATEMWTYE